MWHLCFYTRTDPLLNKMYIKQYSSCQLYENKPARFPVKSLIWKTGVIHSHLCVLDLTGLKLYNCWLHNRQIKSSTRSSLKSLRSFYPLVLTSLKVLLLPLATWIFPRTEFCVLSSRPWEIWGPKGQHVCIYKTLQCGLSLVSRGKSPWRP